MLILEQSHSSLSGLWLKKFSLESPLLDWAKWKWSTKLHRKTDNISEHRSHGRLCARHYIYMCVCVCVYIYIKFDS